MSYLRYTALLCTCLLPIACGGDGLSEADEEADGSGGAGTGGSTGSGGSDGTGGAGEPVALEPQTCETPWLGFASCSSSSNCTDPVSAFQAAVDQSVCFEGLGLFSSDSNCRSAQMVGRCYEAANETWRTYYRDYSSSLQDSQRSAHELMTQCNASAGGVWCINPFGVSPATAAHCSAICEASRPDYAATDTAECAISDECESDCWAESTDASCEDCVSITDWPVPSCSDFECSCTSPIFESAL